MFGFARDELKILKALKTPRKIQDFLERIPINFEKGRETCLSPRMVLARRRAHCMEGAMLAAAALRLQGHRPLVVDLKAADEDDDHVIAVFRQHGAWGAITKTNHAVLRYREPIYASIRELALSFFHEYFLKNGKKTLRSYSQPVDLSRFDRRGWMTSEKDVWYIPEYLDGVPHAPILSRAQLRTLRRADPIEIRAGEITAWKRT